MLVASQIDKTVRQYDSTTGAFVKVAATGGALGDPLGVVVGLDGNVLVSDGQTNEVKRYDRATGAFIDVFASTNLAGPSGLAIHDGLSTSRTRIRRRASSGSTPPPARTPGPLSPRGRTPARAT
jgi:hypothetical protein